jgi:primosomal protein N'
MYYYNILPTRSLGGNLSILTFGCQQILEIGQIVEIEIRNSQDYGLIISQNVDYDNKSVGEQSTEIETQEKRVSNNSLEIDINSIESNSKKNSNRKSEVSENKKNDFEIKEITRIFPFKISKQQIEFLQSFTTNTFNSPNDIWSSIFQPFKLLTKKQILELETIFNQNAKKTTFINSKLEELEENTSNSSLQNKTGVKKAPIIDFVLDSDILVRIMYIIRSSLSSYRKEKEHLKLEINEQVLIVFPEKKYLDKLLSEFKLLAKSQGLEKEIVILKYTGEVNKNSKETIWSMIENKLNNSKIKKQIIFTTRSGIFLPFSNLSQIILIDEGNSMYIQDQNSLYFDTRDTIFLLHKSFSSNLTFVSTLPSLRLHSFYNKDSLNTNLINTSSDNKNSVKLKITTLDTKSAKFGLFGWEIEQILRKDEELN